MSKQQKQQREAKRFSEFADLSERPVMDCDKVSMQSVLNKEIKVINYRVKNTKFSYSKNDQCLTIQFETEEGERKVIFTGSAVLIDQIERYKEHLPFYATIVKTGKFFSFS
ncbi:MAG: hypothetical protein RBT70_08750 [Alphaproteobacteria bacterium]|jgi:hypothetical protein|nr:hypothetical protein [Alphaproteobacteria bacterium]